MRNIVVGKEYLEHSEDLFVLFVAEHTFDSYIGWLLEFLSIILNQYASLHYGSKKTQKDHQPMNRRPRAAGSSLRNIARLLSSCEQLLRKNEQFREDIVEGLVDFWCREELPELQEHFLDFMATALEIDEDLAFSCFERDHCCEALVKLVNTSYEDLNEVQAAMRLTGLFLQRLDALPKAKKMAVIYEHNSNLSELNIRLEDYLSNLSREQLHLLKAVEVSHQQLLHILENCDTLEI
jgi:hypothetical protein